jgi:hypothetical protein
MEKRLPTVVVVHLARMQDDPVNAAELTYAENISAHGACVISKRVWQPGELTNVTSLEDQSVLQGKVVHCREWSGDRYAVGLAFQRAEVTWKTFRKYGSG